MSVVVLVHCDPRCPFVVCSLIISATYSSFQGTAIAELRLIAREKGKTFLSFSRIVSDLSIVESIAGSAASEGGRGRKERGVIGGSALGKVKRGLSGSRYKVSSSLSFLCHGFNMGYPSEYSGFPLRQFW